MSLFHPNADRSRVSARAALACCAVFAALALWLLARTAWTLWPNGDASAPAASLSANIAVPAAPVSVSRLRAIS